MKKGDVVRITDGSWTESVVNGKLIEETLNCGDEGGKKYVVVETGCYFPLCVEQPGKYRNDTVIQAVDSGKVVFIHGAFLKLVLPKHKVMVDIKPKSCVMCGNIVEISDELYRKIQDEQKA